MKSGRHIEPLVQLSGDQILFRTDLQPDRLPAEKLVSKSNLIDLISAAPHLLHHTHAGDAFQK